MAPCACAHALMIIAPRIRGYICTTAHPIGCAQLVREQAAWTRARPIAGNGAAPSVLVIGGSAGYGLASRVTCAFARGARTLSLSYEKSPTLESTGTAGWYNNRAFEELASASGLYARSIDADAFADETKARVADVVRQDLRGLDLLVYSLASPVRKDPESGTLFRSAIKAVGNPVRLKTLHVEKGAVQEIDVPAATEDEIHATVKVMGGEDWERWIEYFQSQGLLNRGFRTVAYTYIGSELTWPVYWDGTLGKAKEDLDRAAGAIRAALAPLSGDARVAVLKAVVTQASSAIPAIPLYVSLLFKVMKEQGLHEDCQQNIDRLFRSAIFADGSAPTDPHGRWRVDDWELRADVQADVTRRWDAVTSENVMALSDLAGFRRDFLRIFGFGVDEVDYTRDVSPLG
jgi:enoyl-[acyl-carrier protein] reductase/trans-2-enoyl-CoA reductase (NAD+)